MRLTRSSVLFALITLVGASLWAQTASTSLNGTVTDPKGSVIPDATLTLSNPQTGFTRSLKTNGQGAYQFLQVPPATYELRLSAAGFATLKQSGVVLMVNTPATLDLPMRVAGADTVVEVTGTAPLVNTQDASLGHAFNSDQISYLPFEGREAASILSLQAGVVYTGNTSHPANDSRSGAVNGARSDQTNVTLDGIDNNDQTQGLAFAGALRATLDSLQEFKVTTSNATADAGRSSGGQVALVTKSGTNSIHGTAYWYYRPPFGAANDWFNKRAELGSGLPNKPPFLLRNTFGATFGGPIKKNRLFYFLAYEGQRTRESLQVTRIVPSAGLRNGSITYQCSQDPSCPAGGNFTLTPADLSLMDPNCTSLGSCPLGPGANPAVMQILQKYPVPNTNGADPFNFQGFTFSSPLPSKQDTYVAKIDYNLTANGSHQVFVRGGLMGDRGSSANDPTSTFGSGGSEFPGQPANITHLNNTRGIIAGYTAVLRNNLLNNFRYGFIRQGFVDLGRQTQHYINFRGLDNLTAQTPSTRTLVPVHNFADDIVWTKGAHTMQFGGNLRVINNIRNSNSTSFFTAQTDSFWLTGGCVACSSGVPGSLDPRGFGFPAVNSDFSPSYDFAVTALAGLVTTVGSNYNLTKNLTPLQEGAQVPRHFRDHELEFYAQDSYRMKPNLTVTFGLRYTLLQPPYETNGTQVAPDTSIDAWFKQRGAAMLKGQAYEPLLSFSLSGQANGKKPYWEWDHEDFAPRIAIAYSPKAEDGFSKRLWGGPGKSSIRMGYGMYYDHFGEGIVNSFDQLGSFGLTTALSNPAGVQTVDGSARFSDINTIPTTSASTSGTCPVAPCPIVEAAPSGSFPVVPPAGLAGGYAITWGLDDRLRTPYSHLMNLSVERELPKGFVFEAAYVGRFAHRLLQEVDLAMPADLHDPQSKMDYFTAATLLAKQYQAKVPIENVQPIPYWENIYPAAAGPSATQIGGDCGKPGVSCSGLTNGLPANVTATQAMYDLFAFNAGNETTALEFADVPGLVSANGCYPACASINGQQTPFTFYSPQYSSLYAWRSDGNSAYHAGQFSLRRRMADGLQFDLNYTYSKSMDVGSNAERINHFQGSGFASQVLNSWFPKQLRGPSDFDVTHQVNANWVYQLPFGSGKRFGRGMNRWLDAAVGGWTVSGLWRWTSGYPFSISSGFGWATNFDEQSLAVLNGKRPRTGTFILKGQPNVFSNPSNPNNSSDPNTAINQFRAALPGESGQRNNLRGPGTFNIDFSVSKGWKITERQSLRASAEAFNLTNTPRFDVGTMQLGLAGNSITSASSFGNFSSTLSNPRILEFSLRYSF